MLRLRILFLFSICIWQLNDNALVAEPLQGKIEHEESTPFSAEAFMDANSIELPAGVSFSENVSPVAQELKVHKLFSSVSLPQEDSEDTWYQIPKWRAGFFHREKQIDHTMFGDVESVSKVDHLYGMQVDKNGGIWHHISWPKITKITADDYIQYKTINSYEPITVSGNEFCVKICSTNVDVDNKTGKIIRVGKQEEIDRYFPAGAGKARGFCLIKGFSQRGNVNTTIEKTSVEEIRLRPFSVLNNFRGKDLQDSFKRFLQAHNLPELIPD